MMTYKNINKLESFFDFDFRRQINLYFDVLTPINEPEGLCLRYKYIRNKLSLLSQFKSSIWYTYSNFTDMAFKLMTPEMWDLCNRISDRQNYKNSQINSDLFHNLYWFSYNEDRIKFCCLLKKEFIKKHLENENIGNI